MAKIIFQVGDRIQERGYLGDWNKSRLGTILLGPYRKGGVHSQRGSYTLIRDRGHKAGGGGVVINVPPRLIRRVPVAGSDYRLHPRHLRVINALTDWEGRPKSRVGTFLAQKTGVTRISAEIDDLMTFGLVRECKVRISANGLFTRGYGLTPEGSIIGKNAWRKK